MLEAMTYRGPHNVIKERWTLDVVHRAMLEVRPRRKGSPFDNAQIAAHYKCFVFDEHVFVHNCFVFDDHVSVHLSRCCNVVLKSILGAGAPRKELNHQDGVQNQARCKHLIPAQHCWVRTRCGEINDK